MPKPGVSGVQSDGTTCECRGQGWEGRAGLLTSARPWTSPDVRPPSLSRYIYVFEDWGLRSTIVIRS